jgi:hypothetical protein
MPQESLEELKLPVGQSELSLPPEGLARSRVNTHVRVSELWFLDSLATTQKCPDPGHQLVQGKWLDEIVIGAPIEASYTIRYGITSRQEEDGCQAWELVSESLADREAVQAGQDNIEDDQIWIALGGQRERFFASLSRKNVVTFEDEYPPQAAEHGAVVINDKNAHPASEAPLVKEILTQLNEYGQPGWPLMQQTPCQPHLR